MPMHDWTKVTAGIYHDFHHDWVSTIRNHLNAGLLPNGFFAMAEQIIGGPAPDVVTLQSQQERSAASAGSHGGRIALAEPAVAPKSTYVLKSDSERYVTMKKQIVVRHELGEVVAVIELVSPGNKHSKFELRRLIEKSVALIRAGVHLLIVDPFPPTVRDPNGVPGLVWEELCGETDFRLPNDHTLTVSSFPAESMSQRTAYIEPLEVGQPLPTMPLFIAGHRYIDLPLEGTYLETWSKLPRQVQVVVAG